MKEERIKKILTYSGAAFLFIFCIAPFAMDDNCFTE